MKNKKLTKRMQQALDTKQKILDVALELFAEHGYSSVTVDRICEDAGVSKGGFYNHFDSKQEIILTQLRNTDQVHQGIHDNWEPGISSIAKLLSFVQAQFEYFSELGCDVLRVTYHSELSPERENFITDQTRPIYKILHEIIEEGQAKGEIQCSHSVDAIVDMVVWCIRGIVFEWILSNGTKDMVAMGNLTISSLISGIRF